MVWLRESSGNEEADKLATAFYIMGIPMKAKTNPRLAPGPFVRSVQ
jgi:hypothetical protein